MERLTADVVAGCCVAAVAAGALYCAVRDVLAGGPRASVMVLLLAVGPLVTALAATAAAALTRWLTPADYFAIVPYLREGVFGGAALGAAGYLGWRYRGGTR